MKETSWVGPRGTHVVIVGGSTKPPRWALLLIDRVCAREQRTTTPYIRLGWVVCSRGCAHGYGSPGRIKIYSSGDRLADRSLLYHELSHAFNRRSVYRDRHGPGFYDALYRISKAEGWLMATTRWQGNRAAMRRAKLRHETRTMRQVLNEADIS